MKNPAFVVLLGALLSSPAMAQAPFAVVNSMSYGYSVRMHVNGVDVDMNSGLSFSFSLGHKGAECAAAFGADAPKRCVLVDGSNDFEVDYQATRPLGEMTPLRVSVDVEGYPTTALSMTSSRVERGRVRRSIEIRSQVPAGFTGITVDEDEGVPSLAQQRVQAPQATAEPRVPATDPVSAPRIAHIRVIGGNHVVTAKVNGLDVTFINGDLLDKDTPEKDRAPKANYVLKKGTNHFELTHQRTGLANGSTVQVVVDVDSDKVPHLDLTTANDEKTVRQFTLNFEPTKQRRETQTIVDPSVKVVSPHAGACAQVLLRICADKGERSEACLGATAALNATVMNVEQELACAARLRGESAPTRAPTTGTSP